MKAFDDIFSWLHFLYAFLMAFLEPAIAVASSIIFYAYQRYEREKWEHERGDFIEWLTGLLAGAVAHEILVALTG